MTPVQSTTPPRHSFALTDRLRRHWYLTRLGLALSWLVPDIKNSDWLSLRRSLKADIEAAAAQVGLAEALHDLGPVARLGASYAESFAASLRPDRPRWSTGALVTVLVWAAQVALTLVFIFGMLASTLDTNGRATATWLGLRLETWSEASGSLGVTLSLGPWSWIPALILAVVFALASRVWRLWRRI